MGQVVKHASPNILRAAFLMALAVTACGRPAAETAAPGAPTAASAYVPLATFPPLGPAKPVERGIVAHAVALTHGNESGRIWIYLPEPLPAKPIPAVFVAPAGVPPFVGSEFGPDLDRQRHPEHLPYVRAGFAVVAYEIDGALVNRDDVTYEQVRSAAEAFKASAAGVLNGRHAIDYVLKMVPAIDHNRLYSVGHSSAGRHALILAANDSRIVASIAYAPVTDVERRANRIAPDASRYLEANVPGFRDFLKETSPLRQAARLKCPAFIFHSTGDGVIDIRDTELFVEELKKTNASVTFLRVTHGDHYDSMIRQGIPAGIKWLRRLNE